MSAYWSFKNKAVKLSCAIHGAFFLFVIVASIVHFERKENKVHVFDLISPVTAEAKQAPEAFPEVKTPDVKKAELQAHKTPIKQLPAPVKTEVTKSEPAAKKVTKPHPKPEKKLVSYDEFVKKHGKPQTSAPPQVKPVAVPRISTKGFSAQLQNVVVQDSVNGSWTQTNNTAFMQYLAELKQKLDAVWLKPQSLSKLTHLEALVEFTIEPSGKLNAVHVVGASGQPLFDESVIRAFTQLQSAGRPPDGKRYSLRLTFRMEG